MREWTGDDQLRFDIAFALSQCTLKGFRRPWHKLSDLEQRVIAQNVVEHLKRCRWDFTKPDYELGPSPMSRPPKPSSD